MGEVVEMAACKGAPGENSAWETDPFLRAFSTVHGLGRASQELEVQLGVVAALYERAAESMREIPEAQQVDIVEMLGTKSVARALLLLDRAEGLSEAELYVSGGELLGRAAG